MLDRCFCLHAEYSALLDAGILVLFIYLFICLFICLFVCLFVYLFICFFIYLLFIICLGSNLKKGFICYTTLYPCMFCSTKLIGAGVSKIIY
jgi:pyrimidine deaminase RibD-like protein